MEFDFESLKGIYYEESEENLSSFESILVNFDVGKNDEEEINTLFRVMHSLKGGSATFGMFLIDKVAHVAETLLDQIRSKKLSMNKVHVEKLLQCKDLVESLIKDYKLGQETKQADVDEMIVKLNQELIEGTQCIEEEKTDEEG